MANGTGLVRAACMWLAHRQPTSIRHPPACCMMWPATMDTRKLLSSRSLTSGSGMNWRTPKKNISSGRRQSTSLLPTVSDDSSPSKENDGGAMISRANNTGSFLTPPSSSRKGGRKNNKSSRPLTSRNSQQ